MTRLNFDKIKFKAEIITPIHIWSGQVWDRLDYFVFEDWEEIQIVKRDWLKDCATKDENLFKKIIFSIEKGNFIELENLKWKYYYKYFDPEKFLIEKIPISKEAMEYLTMSTRNYTNIDRKGNVGEIKRFAFSGYGDVIIPGSTLKGLFRTMFLMDIVNQENISFSDIKKNLDKKNLDKLSEREVEFFVFTGNKKFNALKDPLAWVSFDDINLGSKVKKEIKLINIRVTNKRTKRVRFIPIICEMITEGNFEFSLTYSDLYQENVRNSFVIDDIEYILSNYSENIKQREKINIDNVLNKGKFTYINYGFLNEDNKNNLVKIGEFKREYTYKIYWNPREKKFVHIDSFYIDENNNPIGWIKLEIVK